MTSLMDNLMTQDDNDTDYILKLSILGNGRVGKTSLCSAFEAGVVPGVYNLTVGLEIRSKTTQIEGTNVRLVLWDLAGQERFKCVRDVFYDGTHVAAVVFDVSNRGSFYDVHDWIRNFRDKEKEAPMILVGNKIDLKGREVSKEEALDVAKKYNIPYIETSAKTGENVANTFRSATAMALKRSMKGNVVAY